MLKEENLENAKIYKLNKSLIQEPLFTQAGKSCSQEVRQVSLLQRKRSLTVPGGAGCQSSCLAAP